MMTINLAVWLPTIIGLITIIGFIVKFFQNQTKQNARIEILEEKIKEIREMEIPEIKRKISDQTKCQIQTEKDIISINGKLDNIEALLKEVREAVKPKI